jgi:HKD family nuclease
MFKIRKIIIISLLFLPISIGYTQSESSDEENPITDPVLLEKLRQIDTMEKLLEITRSDSITTGALNDEREEKFIDARDRQKALLDEAKARLTLEEERAVRLQKQFEENEKILEEISETLRIRIGNFGELFGL